MKQLNFAGLSPKGVITWSTAWGKDFAYYRRITNELSIYEHG
jgi:hypothetical protein